MNAAHDLPGDTWLRIATSRDGDEAQTWRLALEDAGVDVQVRIDDALIAQPGSSPLTAVGAPQLAFAYQFFVPHAERDRAAAALIDAGWRPIGQRGVRTETVVMGALLAVGAAALVVIVRAALT
jgi:hypothetical protein